MMINGLVTILLLLFIAGVHCVVSHGPPELTPGRSAAILEAIRVSPHIPDEWKALFEAAIPFNTLTIGRSALYTRFESLTRTRSGISPSATLPAAVACRLWGTLPNAHDRQFPVFFLFSVDNCSHHCFTTGLPR
jgi:hypothetical protein